ncbi:MAG: adenosylcobinamide amidohydrolase [Solibacillus sp.]
MLKVENIAGGYGQTPVVQDISFEVAPGKILGILGPNGSGKSTLLKLISGTMKPLSGAVYIEGQALHTYKTKQLAQKMAVLPQLHANAFSNTVYDAVALGRYPHQSSFFASWSEEDELAVVRAMRDTGVLKYRDTQMEFLSGGEQQRVFIAQALAQQSQILLLDEPTNHLDIAHQKQILDMIRRSAAEQNMTVVSVFHDINLASLYCDELLLMENGEIRAYGEPHEVVQEARITKVYDAPITTYAHPELPKPQITMLPTIENNMIQQIERSHFKITNDYIQLAVRQPLKVVSSAVHNAGIGWYDTLLNRSIAWDYNIELVGEETLRFLEARQFAPTNTVVMLTAVPTNTVALQMFEAENCSIVVMVTAGVGNSIDVTRAYERNDAPYIGTINTWVIVNGKLSDEAFIQAMITATEAKTKALQEQNIIDANTGTIATGTATDSLLIAATQQGAHLPYAGPITELGKLIGRGIFETTVQAINNYIENKTKG